MFQPQTTLWKSLLSELSKMCKNLSIHIDNAFWRQAWSRPNRRWKLKVMARRSPSQKEQRKLRWKLQQRQSRRKGVRQTRTRDTRWLTRRSQATTAVPRSGSWISWGLKNRYSFPTGTSSFWSSHVSHESSTYLGLKKYIYLLDHCSLQWYEPELSAKDREQRCPFQDLCFCHSDLDFWVQLTCILFHFSLAIWSLAGGRSPRKRRKRCTGLVRRSARSASTSNDMTAEQHFMGLAAWGP